jgi:hypothetical protein
MKAKDLIGKKVTRTGVCTYENGTIDRSYMGDILIILNANDFMISYMRINDPIFGNKMFTLSKPWCDENWECVEEFMNISELNHSKAAELLEAL